MSALRSGRLNIRYIAGLFALPSHHGFLGDRAREMDSTITTEIWRCASACCGDDFEHALSELLDSYERKPGKDEPVRVTAEWVGHDGYTSLVVALNAKSRRGDRNIIRLA